MKKVLVKSIFDTFDYVMNHYYPFEMEDMAIRKDTYAIVSIQDSHTHGFGITFSKNIYCKDVLTLYFDDIVKEVEGAILFNEDMANQIIDFIYKNKNVDTMIVHCFAGQSRSRAIGAFILKMFHKDNEKYFKEYSPNLHVYNTLIQTFEKR